MLDLSLQEARAIALSAQGLHTKHIDRANGEAVLDRLGCIQLDTISVVRRSHELIQLARGVPPTTVAGLISHAQPPTLFEYWGHAASLMPIKLWPWFGFRRRNYRAKGWTGPAVDPAAVTHVRAVLADRESATISDLGGAQGNGWERSSANKWALEWLLATGELACVHRKGWQRVYQLSERVVPTALLQAEPDDAECLHQLAGIALRALGVATADDVADYFRLPARKVSTLMHTLPGAEAVRVEGWKDPAWAASEALTPAPVEAACTPLSPFDSLIWHRPRMGRLFGVEYLLEAYKPAARRECGYFGMPVLHGDKIVGRVALRISKRTAVIEGHQLIEGHDPALLDQAIATACAWADAQHTPALALDLSQRGDTL
ncbi:winged helix-turn-helix domain-containing protein [Streptomyces sp. NRRL S-146]|uniref:winged helix-turn-helix domain-containing protein n=1 Tax=Streptomyces sp. NRRL S-146 TaxID=1463884 RepID=UPI0006909FFC|nr:crosslink repair DNA glycosylase YcaQ family protein [Streptomyces sp. NRRL S-146]